MNPKCSHGSVIDLICLIDLIEKGPQAIAAKTRDGYYGFGSTSILLLSSLSLLLLLAMLVYVHCLVYMRFCRPSSLQIV